MQTWCSYIYFLLFILQLLLYNPFKPFMFMCHSCSVAFNLFKGLSNIFFLKKMIIFQIVYLNFDLKHFFPIRSVFTTLAHFPTMRAKLLWLRWVYEKCYAHTLTKAFNFSRISITKYIYFSRVLSAKLNFWMQCQGVF